MHSNQPLNQVLVQIFEMDRERALTALRAIERPRLDFTEEFLAGMSTEQLKHVLAAACIQADKVSRRAA